MFTMLLPPTNVDMTSYQPNECVTLVSKTTTTVHLIFHRNYWYVLCAKNNLSGLTWPLFTFEHLVIYSEQTVNRSYI